MYKFSPSTSLQVKKHHFLGARIFCCTNINPPLLRIINEVDFRNNSRYIHFLDFIYEVINLSNIDLCNPFVRVFLLTIIFTIFGLVSNLIEDETFNIELLSNHFPLRNNIFLLVFVCLSHLFNYILFRGRTKRVGSSFGQLIVLFYL